ncbi:ABC transporter ATP-binding protein [Bradyrhizobium sp. HKCCYLS20291]|uniref:ABC transporter ATP-binding protein n=1 Tax=Bradyrhizobium sp. HKCCYLS20291 TaxID=3420766 RepID=UPI003EBBAEE1
MTAFAAAFRLLGTVPRRRTAALLILMMLTGLSEGAGLLLLIPLLDLLGPSPGAGGAHLSRALAFVGLPMTLQAMLALFVGVVVIRNILQYARERLAASVQFRFVDSLRRQCLSAVLNAEWRWLVGQRQSDHASLLLTDVNRTGIGLNAGIALLAGVATTLAYLCAALLVSWKVTALAGVSGGLVFWLLARQRRKALQLGRTLGDAGRALHADVQQSLAGIKLAKTLGAEHLQHATILASSSNLQTYQLAFVAGASLSKALFQTAGAGLVAIYVYVGLSWWRLPMAEILTLVAVFARLIPMFGGLQQQLHLWLHAVPAFAEAEQLLAECRRAAQPSSSPGATPLVLRREISLARVTVRHAGRDEPALADVSLRFPVRTTTAIIGPSGAGKSTLVDVIAGLLEPDSGSVAVDGAALSGTARASWRQTLAYVPQELFLFNDTVRANLLWARPIASETELHDALRLAAADFVMRLPDGLDTVIGDAGTRLSGGERQRIAIARALTTRPDVLILDEATSALDLDADQRIQEVLDSLRGRMTIFIIRHRLSHLDRTDQVVALREGRVIASGRWQEVSGVMG